MAKFYMKKISADVYKVQSGRDRIGQVIVPVGQDKFVGKVEWHGQKVRHEASDPRDVFDALVRSMNRITLCGRDDEEAARAHLNRRNEEVRDEARRLNAKLEGIVRVKIRNRGVAI